MAKQRQGKPTTDNKRLKSFLHPAEGIDGILFIRFLYLLMDRYMDDRDNIPDRCIEAQGEIEQHFRYLSQRDELTPEEEDMINELETTYMWYGIYAGLEFYAMLEREMADISDITKRIHPDNKIGGDK